MVVFAGILMILVVIGLVVMIIQFATRNGLAAWLTLMITAVLFTGAMMLLGGAGAGNGDQLSEAGLRTLQWAGVIVFLFAGLRRFVSRFTRWRSSRSQ